MAFLQCSLDALYRSTCAFFAGFFRYSLTWILEKLRYVRVFFLQCSLDALYKGATGHFCRVL